MENLHIQPLHITTDFLLGLRWVSKIRDQPPFTGESLCSTLQVFIQTLAHTEVSHRRVEHDTEYCVTEGSRARRIPGDRAWYEVTETRRVEGCIACGEYETDEMNGGPRVFVEIRKGVRGRKDVLQCG